METIVKTITYKSSRGERECNAIFKESATDINGFFHRSGS